MKTIVILTSFEGHVSLAMAVAAALREEYTVVIETIRPTETMTYMPFYRLFPSLFSIPYKMAQAESVQKLILTAVKKKYGKRIREAISKHHPDAIISTYMLYNEICSEVATKLSLPLFNVLANPHSTHPIEYHPKAINLVFDTASKQCALDMGIPEDKITVTGWFVRDVFTPVEQKQPLRQKLGLRTQPLTFLVCGGSDGTAMIMKILPSLLETERPIQFVVICGSNTTLYRAMKGIGKLISLSPKHKNIGFHAFGYVKNMHEYIQASDLVIGKAGPNLLFETIACHTPFFAIAHISGQEDANIALMKDRRLGIVQENPITATRILRSIMRNPKKLSVFAPQIQEVAQLNAQAARKLRMLLREEMIETQKPQI